MTTADFFNDGFWCPISIKNDKQQKCKININGEAVQSIMEYNQEINKIGEYIKELLNTEYPFTQDYRRHLVRDLVWEKHRLQFEQHYKRYKCAPTPIVKTRSLYNWYTTQIRERRDNIMSQQRKLRLQATEGWPEIIPPTVTVNNKKRKLTEIEKLAVDEQRERKIPRLEKELQEKNEIISEMSAILKMQYEYIQKMQQLSPLPPLIIHDPIS